MKAALCLVVVIIAFAYAEESEVVNTQVMQEANLEVIKKSTIVATSTVVEGGLIGEVQHAVAGDMGLKMVMQEDGSPSGKCYCSCNLDNQPVFMEIDPSEIMEQTME